VLSFIRQTADGSRQMAVIMNLTPVPRANYRVGLPRAGKWAEVLNSDAAIFGGSNLGNLGGVTAQGFPLHNQPCSADFFLPPLSVIAFQPA
jgi:1,4-alpha-glucan branching enzyme